MGKNLETDGAQEYVILKFRCIASSGTYMRVLADMMEPNWVPVDWHGQSIEQLWEHTKKSDRLDGGAVGLS